MVMRLCASFVATLIAGAVATQTVSAARAPEVAVGFSDGLVSIRASAAPVSVLLERIAEATGMGLSFTDDKPVDLITLTVEGVTPAQAITRILEGVGVDYVLGLSADRSRIETLVVTTGGLRRNQATPASESPAELIRESLEEKGSTLPGAESAKAPEDREEGHLDNSEEQQATFEPPRPPGLELPNEAHPPLPARPADLPTSPFVPYYGTLNPDGPAPDPNEPLIDVPSPGDIVDMDGMGPNGVPTTERKSLLPETTSAPVPPPASPPAPGTKP